MTAMPEIGEVSQCVLESGRRNLSTHQTTNTGQDDSGRKERPRLEGPLGMGMRIFCNWGVGCNGEQEGEKEEEGRGISEGGEEEEGRREEADVEAVEAAAESFV